MSYEEFGDTSPAELDLLMSQQQIASDLDNYRTGLIVAATYNTLRNKQSDKVWTPQDFFTFRSMQRKPLPQTPEVKATEENLSKSQVDVLTSWYVSTKSRLKRTKAESRKGNG